MLDFRFLFSWSCHRAWPCPKSVPAWLTSVVRASKAGLLFGLLPLVVPALAQLSPSTGTLNTDETVSEAKLAFERAQPSQARLLLNRYLIERPEDPQALLEAGEIDLACFRDELAQERLAHALRIAPLEPRVLRACSRVAKSPVEEVKLLGRYVMAGMRSSAEKRSDLEDAVAHLKLHQSIGDSEPWRVASPGERYQIKMATLLAATGMRIGYGLPVSINGAKPMQLLLDSGADNILISEKHAKSLHLKYFAEGRIVSVSGRETAASRLGVAETVTIGDLVFHDAVVQVMPHEATVDQDGLIGLAVFSKFLVGLDLRQGKHVLKLEPLPEARVEGDQSSVNVVRMKHLLLVRTRFAPRMEGFFVLDTGCAYSAVDSRSAERIPAAHMWNRPLEMKTATGFLAANRWTLGPGALEVDGHPLQSSDVISLDLERFSRNHGFQVTGLIGLSSLAGALVSVNYRDGAVNIGRQ